MIPFNYLINNEKSNVTPNKYEELLGYRVETFHNLIPANADFSRLIAAKGNIGVRVNDLDLSIPNNNTT